MLKRGRRISSYDKCWRSAIDNAAVSPIPSDAIFFCRYNILGHDERIGLGKVRQHRLSMLAISIIENELHKVDNAAKGAFGNSHSTLVGKTNIGAR